MRVKTLERLRVDLIGISASLGCYAANGFMP
jgi:hypothetical protein